MIKNKNKKSTTDVDDALNVNTKTAHTKYNKHTKKWKILTGVFGGLAATGLATSITLPFVLNKGGDSSDPTDPTKQEHNITYKETTGWSISGPTKAKKGDKVQFSVVAKTNTIIGEIPSKLIFGTFPKDLKESDGTYKTEEFAWPFVEDINIELVTKVAIDETVGVIFDLNGGTLIGGSLIDIKNKGCLLKDANTPSFSAPANQEFIGWSVDGSTVLDKDTYKIESDITLKAIYQNKTSPTITHKLVFVADKDEELKSGKRELTIENGSTWAQVKSDSNFPIITKVGYENGGYYIASGTESKLLEDTDKFSFSTDTTIIINICWTTAEYTITFKNADTKTSFASGKKEETVNVKSGTNFATISRPVVKGSEDTLAKKKYIPNGKWYTDSTKQQEFNGQIDEAKTLYAGYTEEDITESHTYTVNFVNAYGFKTGTVTKWEQTPTSETTYTWANVKSSAPTVDKLNYPDGKSSTESEYEFVGWGMTDADVIPEGNTTVVAQWQAKTKQYYTIVFTSDDQVAWSGSQSFWFETTDPQKTTFSSLSYATPTKQGSTLVGWNVTTTKDGTEKTTSYTGANWETNFKNASFADLADPDTIITCSPIFEADNTKHVVYILSNDTTKGTISFKDGLTAMSYQDSTVNFGTIKSKIITSATSGNEFVKFRNAADGTEITEAYTFTTDTVIVAEFDKENIGLFNGVEWSVVNNACKNLTVSATSTDSGDINKAVEFCNTLGKTDAVAKTNVKETLEANLVGLQGTVKINGQHHTVRIIGCMHDTIAVGQEQSGSATLTFEFANLISDKNGYSLATYWNNTNDTSTANNNYSNSSIRAALTGEGTGTANWFEKDSKSFSTTYTGSILSMLPTELQGYIKTVDKFVQEKSGSWSEPGYSDKLFLMTPEEMGYTPASAGGTEGSTYKYYSGKTAQKDASRIKAQVNGSTNARTTSLSGKDLSGEYTDTKTSWAGYNSTTAGFGGVYWLSSPNITGDGQTWGVYHNGFAGNGYGAYNSAYAVAPCFCI